MDKHAINKSIFLKATPAEVWDYLTQPDKLSLWFHAPNAPLKEGEDYTMYGAESRNPVIWGHIFLMQPHTFLEYSFKVGPMGDDADSRVKWHLHEVAGGTRLSLEHTGLPDDAAGFDLTLALDKGWDDHLGQMRANIHP